jgi:hypothetical protein
VRQQEEIVADPLGPRATQRGVDDQRSRERLPVLQPNRFLVDQRNEELQIRYRWFRWTVLLMALFCVVWDGFLVSWFLPSILRGAWEIALFGSLHAAVGIGLTYATLAGFLNRTRIRTTGRRIRIDHGPLPWLGNRTIDAESVEQLFCRETRPMTRSTNRFSYEVRALLKNGRQVSLVGNLVEPEEAAYVEQQIEGRLGIKDRPIAGEYLV